MTVWVLTGLLGAAIILHMARPRFKRYLISAARFFTDLPPARQGQPKLKLGNPFRSLPLYLHLPLLLLLLASVMMVEKTWISEDREGFGVWIMVDTSASMSTSIGGVSRLDLARQEAFDAIDRIEDQSRGKPVCLRLSSFDMERDDLGLERNPGVILDLLKSLKVRPLGTDLNLVRALLANLSGGELNPDCPVTHLVVISDMPAPDWVASGPIQLVWRHVGPPTNNVGFTKIAALRDPLTGLARQIRVNVNTYGKAPPETRLLVTDPKGLVLLDKPLTWVEGSWHGSFNPTVSGRYSLKLTPGGSYSYDDTAYLDISDEQRIRVDWQLADRALVNRLGWVQDEVTPHLRVQAPPITATTTPTLYVDNNYGISGNRQPIADFNEAASMLTDLNLDVAEFLALPGIELPSDFEPVLRGEDDRVWLARRMNPLAAYVPGLPTGSDDNRGKFSSTVFFNAVKWLLGTRNPPPLYHNTNPGQPQPGGNRLVLHSGEGNTHRSPVSFGDITSLEPVALSGVAQPIWPILLALAVFIYATERALAAYGGSRWR